MSERRSFSVQGMHCAGCAAAVERALNSLPVKDVYVNFAAGRLNLSGSEASDAEIIAAVKKAGFKAEVIQENAVVIPEKSGKGEVAAFAAALFFSILLLFVCMGHFPADFRLNGFLQIVLLIPVLIAGRGFFFRGIPALCRGVPNMDSLISCGASAGIIYSLLLLMLKRSAHLYFDTAAMIITLIMLGKLLESRSRRSASSAIRQLFDLTPPAAHLLRNGVVQDIPSAELFPGDMIRILPGEKIPADSVVESGRSFVNEAMLTGENEPVSKNPQDQLFGGTLNMDGVLEAKVTATGKTGMLGQIISLIDNAQNSRPPAAVLADKVSGFFVWGIFSIALLTAVFWGIFGTAEQALHFSLSVLVVACPCALGLAVPVALISGIGRGAQLGILIRNGEALEKAAKIKELVFDKTGTLTTGIPEIKEIICTGKISANELLLTAAAVEKYSNHPVAGAIVAGAEKLGLHNEKDIEISNFSCIPGRGVSALAAGKNWIFGNAEMMKEYEITFDRPENLSGNTLIYCAVDREFCGVILVCDTLRDNAVPAVAELKKMGINCYMLTGDNRETAEKVAGNLALDGFKSELLPQDKVSALQAIRAASGGRITAMVGDGINDAPALAAGDLGIAIGSGSDIALESADVVLLRSDLSQVVAMIRLSQAAFRVIRQNLFWAFFYNVCCIPLAAGVFYAISGILLDPAFCAGAMACSSLTVVLNSLRLRFFRP